MSWIITNCLCVQICPCALICIFNTIAPIHTLKNQPACIDYRNSVQWFMLSRSSMPTLYLSIRFCMVPSQINSWGKKDYFLENGQQSSAHKQVRLVKMGRAFFRLIMAREGFLEIIQWLCKLTKRDKMLNHKWFLFWPFLLFIFLAVFYHVTS